MFYYKIPWFYQDFNLYVLSSRCKNTGPIIRNHLKSSQMRNKTPLATLKAIPPRQNRSHISIFQKPNSSMLLKIC